MVKGSPHPEGAQEHSPFPHSAVLFHRQVRPLGLGMGWDNLQPRPRFPRSELRLPPLRGPGQATLLRVTIIAPGQPLPKPKKRGLA